MKLFGNKRKPKRKQANCAAVIVAAGTSSRMAGTDKILADLCGEPVILHTIRAFEAAADIEEIVVVTSREKMEPIRALVQSRGFSKVKSIVEGGETRTESVLLGLLQVGSGVAFAAIHDGARPLVSQEMIESTVKAATKQAAAAPGIALKDTVKTVDGRGMIVSTPDRETLRAVQTPQVFDLDFITAALTKAQNDGKHYSDDCAAAEAMGMPVALTEGSEENMKITTPLDLKVARFILESRAPT